ncbi:hypothetical protein HS125_18980 [bacterium]|nr:hypothetical protein [bacterium]
MPAPRSLAFLCVFLLAGGARALQWEVSDLSERPVVDAPLGLALDSGGRPSVAFVDEKRQRLLLARRIGGVWEEEEVFHPAGLGARAGEALDLAIDAHGRRHLAHASFRAYQGVQLEYLSDRRGTWQMETPGGPRRFGYDAAVALDPSGGAHLACRSARPDNDLYLVSPKGAGWEILDVETEGHVGFWIDLAMGGSYLPAATHPDNAPGSGAGRRYKPFIAHAVYDKSQEKGAGPPLAVHLRYIDPKGQWTTDVLPVSNAGYGLSLALSQWEEPHLTFGGGGRLYHAEKIATTTEGARAGWAGDRCRQVGDNGGHHGGPCSRRPTGGLVCFHRAGTGKPAADRVHVAAGTGGRPSRQGRLERGAGRGGVGRGPLVQAGVRRLGRRPRRLLRSHRPARALRLRPPVTAYSPFSASCAFQR